MRAWVGLLMAIPSLAQAPSLKQLMRSVLLPNSNTIFSVQSSVPKNDMDWQAVENAAMNIEGAANLVLMPGRVRSNGQPVPVQSADYIKFAQALVPAGAKCLKAAKARSLDAIGDCTDLLSDSCDNCHKVYRDKP
jgi:cytochrome c556